jgi:hypothetical protein
MRDRDSLLCGPLRFCVFALSVCLLAASVSAELFEPKQRFLGMRNNLARVNDERVTEWGDQAAVPKLAGQPIFDAANPFRWLIDQAVPLPVAPEAFVEFLGGDCLPGRVVDFVPAETDSFEAHGELLVVEPLISVDVPGQPTTPFLRVDTRWLRRVVFQKRSTNPQRYQPGTVFLHDGSQVKFRVIRWSETALSVLTEGGVHNLLFSQVAELHMPAADPWNVYFEQLATLSPNLGSRLLQVETSTGLTLTASTERYRPQFSGDKNKSEDWYPLFQPAWSLDPISVPFKEIRTWRFFSALEPPMTLFEPTAARLNPVFSGGWNWQRNLSVQQSPLKNVSLLSGWGFGVHAPTELVFALHPTVTGIRSRLGLDNVVEKGGSAEALIALSTNEAAPLYKSGVLIGSDKTADSNWLNVTASADGKALLKLKADPAITTRPKGSDPFDIRDCIDWLEPQWRLDAAKTKLEVQSRQVQSLVALGRWKLSSKAFPGELTDAEKKAAKEDPMAAGITVAGFRDDTIPEAPRYRLALQPQDQFVVVSRDVDIAPNDRWLALCVSRHPAATTPTLAQVRINGRAILQQVVPDRTARADPDPILAPVSDFVGKKARVEVVLIAQGDKSLIDWRGAKLLARRPGLVKLFDEEEEGFLKQLGEGEGEASLASTEKSSGNSSLKVTGGELSHVLGDGGFPIREFPQLGEYRYFRFAWKKDGGSGIGLRIGHDGQFGIPEIEAGRQGRVRAVPAKALQARQMRNRERRVRNPRAPEKTDARGAQFGYQYDAGTREAVEPVLRLDKKLPAKWTPLGRDIFGEFGTFSLTGLSFACPDGTAAYFDGIYLARTQSDFQYIPEALGGSLEADVSENENVVASARRPENLGVLLSKVAPQFTLDKIGEPVLHLKEFAGRKDIIQTMPPAQNVPCVLRAPVSVRAGKKTVLAIAANRHAEGDWQLNVKVGAEQLHTSLVDATTAKDGWVELEVDLSKFAGKNIVVEVHNHPNNWSYEHAYWSRLAIVEK